MKQIMMNNFAAFLILFSAKCFVKPLQKHRRKSIHSCVLPPFFRLRSGKFLDFNSACLKVLVRVKIFQFQGMFNESKRYWYATNSLVVDTIN